MAAAPRIELDSRDPSAVDGKHIRAVAFQGVRLAYLRGVLAEHGADGAGTRVLVVGNGHGPLAGSLAALGPDVTAADPSPDATAMAEADSKAANLAVTHVTAAAEELPFENAAFRLVHIADTFETTHALDAVVREAARVLAPGGVLTYDTVNRTWLAKLIYLGAFQRLPATRIVPPGRYSADRLRPPAELAAAFTRHALAPGPTCGFKPKEPRRLVTATRLRRQGRITDADIPPLVDFVLDPDGPPLVTYLGQARKPPAE